MACTCSSRTFIRLPFLDPPQRFPAFLAATWPAFTRSPLTSVSYAATEANTFAMRRPEGVPRSISAP